MEKLNALGVSCIGFIQYWFQPYEQFFMMMNQVSNHHHLVEKLFPFVAIFDSVFASQILLCFSFGGWLNSVVKWLVLEDRPFWWVRETDYYDDDERPTLRQTIQTCEASPGNPSGHSTNMAMLLILVLYSAAHVANDRKWKIPSYVKTLGYVACVVLLFSVFLSRMYVAAHFPHQVLLGGLLGLILAPVLCIYVSDPYIWCYGMHKDGLGIKTAQRWHVAGAVGAGVIAIITYLGLKACNQDPQQTVRQAFRWCQHPEHIHVSTTPVFSLVQCTGYLLGWAFAVTPNVAKYRHDTKGRSLLISAALVGTIMYSFKYINDHVICKNNTLEYYASRFIIYTLKPMFYLNVVPAISMWPYKNMLKTKTS